MESIYIAIPMLCLLASLCVGIFSQIIGRSGARNITILAVAISCALSVVVAIDVTNGSTFDGPIYTWAVSDGISFQIGFLIDELSALMMVVVTFVSLIVHIYTIGYMREDPGYSRFFSYISLFTFAMLVLVMSNNFLQLFFGWEAVGLVSYLLIGFWYDGGTATFASLKASLVNRVGDMGFLLGIAAIVWVFGSLDYTTVFSSASYYSEAHTVGVFGNKWSWMTIICLLLFVGAMGKSAQVPLHIWLPDSMEGPTPISALIHAATMVTAGIFMVARMSPLFEHSETALTVVMVIGAFTAVSMALIALVQNDIKRVVAYSTLSQLGYMTVALGVSAYSVAIFHLTTHAFFKALLFLCAGSVIVALHHEQDMRRMGALWKRMPITYVTTLIGSLALVGIPPFAGFFSKDAIIESVRASQRAGANFAYLCVLIGVFLTALYSFRLIFKVFHGRNLDSNSHKSDVREPSRTITIPLIILSIPSTLAGIMLIDYIAEDVLFGRSIATSNAHGPEVHDRFYMLSHFLYSMPFWLALTGIFIAWVFYIKRPDWLASFSGKLSIIHRVLLHKYGFDYIYERFAVWVGITVGKSFFRYADRLIIDDGMVNGAARLITRLAGKCRSLQTGYVYHYAFSMIIGLVALMAWLFVY